MSFNGSSHLIDAFIIRHVIWADKQENNTSSIEMLHHFSIHDPPRNHFTAMPLDNALLISQNRKLLGELSNKGLILFHRRKGIIDFYRSDCISCLGWCRRCRL